MHIGDAKTPSKLQDSTELSFGIPVIVFIGLPVLALLVLLFLGFGFILQSQRADLTKTYFERTAGFLASDLADQLGKQLTPAAQYVDTLAATIKRADCQTLDCVSFVIRTQRAIPSRVPSQITYIGFADMNGRFFGVFKPNCKSVNFPGTAAMSETDPTQLELTTPGHVFRVEQYNAREKGWFQAGAIGAEAAWSAPYQRELNDRHLPDEEATWRLTRVLRIKRSDGQLLGVLLVDISMDPIARFLREMTGKALDRISIYTHSREMISIENGELVIIRNNEAPPTAAISDQLIHKIVPLTVENLKGWRLAVTLAPELSQPVLWSEKHTLILLGGLLASLALAAAAAACVVNPVKRLSRAVANVGNLKLDVPIAVPTRVKELAFLATIIEKMRIVLQGNQTRLEFLAYHDPASGVLNQAGLARAYDTLKPKPGQLDLILIKVRNYHHINGIMGVTALARIVARNIALIEKEFESSVVGCINDNEIACLYLSEEGLDSPRVRKVLDRMRAPLEHDGIIISVDISASISSSQNQDDRFDMLLRRANGALHHAEETRSADPIWYNPEITQDLREILEFGGNIAQAIARGEFFVRFQPIAELKTGRIHAAHTSVSWHHPQLGIIRGRKFAAIFEKNGSIRHVGLFVMSRTFEFLHHFKRRSPAQSLQIGINLSYVQLLDPLFIERVTELQKEWGIEAREIKFVITQDATLIDDQQILRTMRQLRKLGFHLTIDQFAMAHVVVKGMTAVRYDSLMIDCHLLQNVEEEGVERTIFQSICGLATNLAMESVAVGIEHQSLIASLVECGCTHGMGPWLGRAGTQQEFLRIYDENADIFAEPIARRIPAGDSSL